MIEQQHNQERREPASDAAPVSRRGMIRSQAKVALALGTTLLTASMAKAAPRPPCFLRGTKLRAVDGERNVENIAIGDQLVTAFGQTRPVQWVGRWQARRKAGEPWSLDVRPVRIRQSALGPNTPYTDLYVSQGHAMFIDGVLVPAGQLVNGSSITFHDAEEVDELEYFHVKMESHDVILAAGAASETLLNYTASDLDVKSEAHCAPILCNGNRSTIAARARSLATPFLGPQKLDVIRSRLRRQAAAIGR
jgi:Hint domain